jgi:aspartate aminotransferase-like enzyme
MKSVQPSVGDRGLRISGPTPLPPRVREAASRQMISHRSEGFRQVLREVSERLRPIFGAVHPVLPFTASGTGGMEAAVVNTIEPGQRVLVLNIGHFGARFAALSRRFGAEVHEMVRPWGEAAEADEVEAELRRSRFDAVLVTHNETSTGVLNPLPELCRAIRRQSDALVIIDAISSAAAVPLRLEDWGADIAVGVTQKALMSPPGLALLAVGDRALARAKACGTPRFYLDLNEMAEAVASGTTTFTPAISVVFALAEALEMIEEEGLQDVYRRHRELAARCRTGLLELGFELVATPDRESPTVTAVRAPAGMSAADLRRRLEREHGVFMATGRGPWKDSVLRIGHMGYVDGEAIEATLRAIAGELDA